MNADFWFLVLPVVMSFGLTFFKSGATQYIGVFLASLIFVFAITNYTANYGGHLHWMGIFVVILATIYWIPKASEEIYKNLLDRAHK